MFERSADGSIGTVFTRPDHPTDVLNVKRGIASLLQVAMPTTQSQTTKFSKIEVCRQYLGEAHLTFGGGGGRGLFSLWSVCSLPSLALHPP